MDTNNKINLNNMGIIKKLVTHNGSFHADDVFATATLSLILKNKGEHFEIIRTRDEEMIKNADYVYDVGGIYDEEKNRFDHHQKGGAGSRDGIEYSSFGLIWKKYGIELSGSKNIADFVDKRLVAPVDASDNGIDLVEHKHNVSPYFLQYFIHAMRPTWAEKNLNVDDMFFQSVEIAKVILSREIIQARDSILAEEKVKKIYDNTEDKRIVVLDSDYPYEYVLNNFPEPLFAVYKRDSDNLWGVRAVRKDPKTFENRKNFPVNWGGLKDIELQNVTGVSDAVFCHRALFLAVAKSKEGAIKLAELALEF